jgi:hypothetical protein
MSTMSHRRRLAALTIGVALTTPSVALGAPAQDGVPSPAGHTAKLVKSYEMNAAGGDYAPPRTDPRGVGSIHTQIGPVGRTSAPTSRQTDDGFALGEAAAGAAIALLLSGGVALVVRTTGRRRQAPTRVGS